MSDVTDVSGIQNPPAGPGLDDVLDVLSRNNRGVMAVGRQIQTVRDLILFAVVFIGALLLGVRRAILQAVSA